MYKKNTYLINVITIPCNKRVHAKNAKRTLGFEIRGAFQNYTNKNLAKREIKFTVFFESDKAEEYYSQSSSELSFISKITKIFHNTKINDEIKTNYIRLAGV